MLMASWAWQQGFSSTSQAVGFQCLNEAETLGVGVGGMVLSVLIDGWWPPAERCSGPSNRDAAGGKEHFKWVGCVFCMHIQF